MTHTRKERESSGSPGSDSSFLLGSENKAPVNVPFARAVPVSPSYFSRLPVFNDSFVVVQDLARKYARLPVIPKDKVVPTAWRTKEQYRLAIGEHVKARDYATCMKLAKRLNQIHPELMPEEITTGLAPFKREVNHYLNKPKPIPIDRFGRAHGVGKRKSSVARAWVVEGTGEVLINGKALSDAFGRVHDRESAVWALKSTDRLDKYNVWGIVQGGGTTGQAEALTLAIAKALCTHEPALKNPLRRGKWTSRRLPSGEPVSKIPSRKILTCHDSRLHHAGSQEGGEEKAWPRQGTEDAHMGQEIVGVNLLTPRGYCIMQFSRNIPERSLLGLRIPTTVSNYGERPLYSWLRGGKPSVQSSCSIMYLVVSNKFVPARNCGVCCEALVKPPADKPQQLAFGG
jgi:small subunit ribosomal protein S9